MPSFPRTWSSILMTLTCVVIIRPSTPALRSSAQAGFVVNPSLRSGAIAGRRPSRSSISNTRASSLRVIQDATRNGMRRRKSSASRRPDLRTRKDIWRNGIVKAATLIGMITTTTGFSTATNTRAAAAAEDGAAAAVPKRWISGKSAQPKGSKERAGTKRDSSYLRCLSDCTTECRKPGQGPSKGSTECLEACQDYCCQTYEQCTYTLKRED